MYFVPGAGTFTLGDNPLRDSILKVDISFSLPVIRISDIQCSGTENLHEEGLRDLRLQSLVSYLSIFSKGSDVITPPLPVPVPPPLEPPGIGAVVMSKIADAESNDFLIAFPVLRLARRKAACRTIDEKLAIRIIYEEREDIKEDIIVVTVMIVRKERYEKDNI